MKPIERLCRRILPIVLCSVLSALPASAQEVPRIDYFDISNFVSTEVFSGEVDRDSALGSDEGAWTREVSSALVTFFGNGSSRARARNEVTDLGYRALMSCRWEGTVGASNLDVQAQADLITIFTVDQATTARFSGTIELRGESGVQVIVRIGGTDVDLSYTDADISAGRITIDEQVSLSPGTFYFGSIEVFAGDVIFDAQSNGRVDVDLTLDIGDRDRDGLPDVWEEDGIDFNGNGLPDIPLFAYGADPDRKDIFVEIDVQQTTLFPLPSLARVVTAFADAPNLNPDGSRGITLHLMRDEQSLPDLVYPADGAGLRAAVAAQKDTWFGTPAERSDPAWETDGKDFKRRAFRYAVIGGKIADLTSGYGEIPGNDFIVAVEDTTFDDRWSEDDKISTFMHEMGHTLGLQHGGADSLLFKPNYISVMNYSFQAPSNYGTNVGWQLDYSRGAFPTLDESALSETAGLQGDVIDFATRRSIVDASPAGSSRNLIYPIPTLGNPVDFDGDGAISTGSVQADVNHIDRRFAASPGEVLTGHDDWANLHLHYSGHPNFDAGVAAGLTTADLSSPAMTPELHDLLREAFGGALTATSVEPGLGRPTDDIRLALPQPNPTHGKTVLQFDTARRVHAELAVYDVRGRRVAMVTSQAYDPGTHRLTWDGHDDAGRPVASGQYYAVLRVDGAGDRAQKITLVR